MPTMNIDIITIFPEAFDTYLSTSILKRSQDTGIVKINVHDLRKYSTDKHKTTDDTSYGGGPGMVMRPEPIFRAVSAIKSTDQAKIILLSAKGKQFRQDTAKEFSKAEQLLLICGRYEGIDQRVADYLADEEISVGPYVLAGGEVPAMIITEAVTRLLPGSLGNPESLKEESFAKTATLEYPQYTKPEIFEWQSQKLIVPKVLLSGNHEEVKKWRTKQQKRTP